MALFTIASQRYENRIDIIENRVNAIFIQLQSPFYKKAFSRMARVQQMKCPVKPEIWKPVSVILFPFQIDTYSEAVDLLKEAVETRKDSLSEVYLRGADLSSADLSGANLSGADLTNANLLLTKNLTIDSLLTVATLKDAKLDSTIVKQFKELYPDKWEELRKE